MNSAHNPKLRLNSKLKILHVATLDKFIPAFVDFLSCNFDPSGHIFWIKGDPKQYQIKAREGVYIARCLGVKKIFDYFNLVLNILRAERIILHGIFDLKIMLISCCMPWALKKCFWVIWGGDLYAHKSSKKDFRWRVKDRIRRFIVPQLGHFVTHIRGDYELAQEWFGAKGVWHECFVYPSNLYYKHPESISPHGGINIILGNSADPSNNHIDALDKLRAYADQDIRIFCPLSYGNPEHAKIVADYGKKIFKEKFVGLFDFMPFEDYMRLLEMIDIAIFNHDRQQAMGNVVALLGMKKKVFMRRTVTSWRALSDMGVRIYDINEIDLCELDNSIKENNFEIISRYFSSKNLASQLGRIFTI